MCCSLCGLTAEKSSSTSISSTLMLMMMMMTMSPLCQPACVSLSADSILASCHSIRHDRHVLIFYCFSDLKFHCRASIFSASQHALLKHINPLHLCVRSKSNHTHTGRRFDFPSLGSHRLSLPSLKSAADCFFFSCVCVLYQDRAGGSLTDIRIVKEHQEFLRDLHRGPISFLIVSLN